MGKYCFWIILVSLAGCKANELGETPPLPVAPSERFSQKSVCFNGSSSLSTVDAGTFAGGVIPLPTLSISFWLRMKSSVPSGRIFQFNDDATDNFQMAWAAPGQIEFSIRYSGTTSALTAPVPTPTDWHHVVMVFDGNNPQLDESQILFVDGALVGKAAFPAELQIFGGQTFQISPAADPLSEGCLDDISVWRRRLSHAEVAQLYNQGVPTQLTGTLNDFDTQWTAEESDSLLVDSRGAFDLTPLSGTEFLTALVDPFKPGDADDPLNNGNAGDNKGDSGSGGTFEGGGGGYGGEFGDGGSGSSGGFFP